MHKEMLSAVPVLTKLLAVPPNRIRAHAKYKVGDIGKYCIVAHLNGRNCYYVMRSDLPKILHRELTPEEEAAL